MIHFIYHFIINQFKIGAYLEWAFRLKHGLSALFQNGCLDLNTVHAWLDDSDDHLRWLAPTDLNLDYMGITHLDCVTVRREC